jgi:hypothetical protein
VVFYREETTAHGKEKVGALGDVSCAEAEKRKGGKWEGVSGSGAARWRWSGGGSRRGRHAAMSGAGVVAAVTGRCR